MTSFFFPVFFQGHPPTFSIHPLASKPYASFFFVFPRPFLTQTGGKTMSVIRLIASSEVIQRASFPVRCLTPSPLPFTSLPSLPTPLISNVCSRCSPSYSVIISLPHPRLTCTPYERCQGRPREIPPLFCFPFFVVLSPPTRCSPVIFSHSLLLHRAFLCCCPHVGLLCRIVNRPLSDSVGASREGFLPKSPFHIRIIMARPRPCQ